MILSLQGCMAVGKTTAVHYLREHGPICISGASSSGATCASDGPESRPEARPRAAPRPGRKAGAQTKSMAFELRLIGER